MTQEAPPRNAYLPQHRCTEKHLHTPATPAYLSTEAQALQRDLGLMQKALCTAENVGFELTSEIRYFALESGIIKRVISTPFPVQLC